jgi:2-iminoacetate synthase ThiH
MTNRPARITQAEIERVIRAAKKAGVSEIEVKIGEYAVVRISLASDRPVAETTEIVL